MVAAGLAIIYLLPRVTKAVPSPLVAIVVLTVVAILFKLDVRRVGELGELPSALPIFAKPEEHMLPPAPAQSRPAADGAHGGSDDVARLDNPRRAVGRFLAVKRLAGLRLRQAQHRKATLVTAFWEQADLPF